MRVELEALGHAHFEDQWLFRGVTQAFEPGHVYAVTGASGSGKSTLMSILSGWTAPKEGRVHAIGVERVSWVFQNPYGVPRRSAVDHVAFPLIARGIPADTADARAHELMEQFLLCHVADRQFRHLSGGEAQRLMLARATAASPDLLLIDEPTAQLDRPTARVIDDVIAKTATDHTIVVVATHDEHTRDACDVHVDLAAFAPEEHS
jgi:ABC-type antimicrobial peptide transport system, ATPase component